jgi:hypothetical protein
MLVPQWTVRSVNVGLPLPEWVALSEELVQSADLWVRMPLDRNAELSEHRVHPRVLNIPPLVFPGFHPDQVFAGRTDGGPFEGVTVYHSAIALWAWKRGYGPDVLSALMTPSTIQALGYLDYWSTSVEAMAETFGASDVRFGPFWMRVKRLGVFMHTFNHPRIEAVSLLAKAIASTIDDSIHCWDDPVHDYLVDDLNTAVWPVYPPVADFLAVPGSFRWRLLQEVFADVDAYASAVWTAYGDTDPDVVFCPRFDDGFYDRVLSEELVSL